MGEDVVLGVGEGKESWHCPMLRMSLNGLKTDFDGTFASRYASRIPVGEVFFRHRGQVKPFGAFGVRLLDFLRFPLSMHESVTCKDFAMHFLAGGHNKQHPNQSWELSPEPISQKDLLLSHPMSVVEFFAKDHTFQHAAVHLEHGLFLYKIGFQDTYVMSELDVMQKLYLFETIHIAVLCAKCHACGATKNPELLLRCASCKQVTYCNRACQRAHWKSHKLHCHLQQNPKRMIHQFRKIKEDTQLLLDQIQASSGAMDFIEKMLTDCNVHPILCTQLETWNDVCFADDPQKHELTELLCQAIDCKECSFFIGRFTQKVLRLILELSSRKAICFTPVKQEQWCKLAHGTLCHHLMRTWPDETIQQDTSSFHHVHGRYQAPFLIRCMLERSIETSTAEPCYYFECCGHPDTHDGLRPFHQWKLTQW